LSPNASSLLFGSSKGMISLPRSCHHGWLQFRRRWSCHLPQDSWAAKVCAIPPNFCHSSGYPLVLKHGTSTSSIINGACLITGSVDCNPLTATSLEWCLVRALSQNGRTCFGLLFRFVLIPEPKHLALGYQSARPVGTWNWAPLWTEALASIQVWTLAEGQSGARRQICQHQLKNETFSWSSHCNFASHFAPRCDVVYLSFWPSGTVIMWQWRVLHWWCPTKTYNYQGNPVAMFG
jgi:hypothetical protein